MCFAPWRHAKGTIPLSYSRWSSRGGGVGRGLARAPISMALFLLFSRGVSPAPPTAPSLGPLAPPLGWGTTGRQPTAGKVRARDTALCPSPRLWFASKRGLAAAAHTGRPHTSLVSRQRHAPPPFLPTHPNDTATLRQEALATGRDHAPPLLPTPSFPPPVMATAVPPPRRVVGGERRGATAKARKEVCWGGRGRWHPPPPARPRAALSALRAEPAAGVTARRPHSPPRGGPPPACSRFTPPRLPPFHPPGPRRHTDTATAAAAPPRHRVAAGGRAHARACARRRRAGGRH